MASSFRGQVPTFVEHFVFATVIETYEGGLFDELARLLSEAIVSEPGVLAAHVGRCVSVLGDHNFIMHIRASDTASCDAAYKSAHEAYMAHILRHEIKTVQDFKDILIVDFETQPIGEWKESWPALRVAIVTFKKGTPQARVAKLEEVLNNLPEMFPVVKQVTWGRNIAKQRMYRGNYEYADVDQEFGMCLAFSSCQDMDTLGEDPNYWELLNRTGISILEKYHVLTLKLNEASFSNTHEAWS